MSAMLSVIRNRPVWAYIIITFGISWGGLFVIAGPGSFPGTTTQTEALFSVALTLLLAGPCVAGVCLVGLIDGKVGYQVLLSRLLMWKVDIRWYLFALLATLAAILIILLPLSLISQAFLPAILTVDEKAALVLSGIAVGILGGILEEMGWTAFAVPKLQMRVGLLATGLIVGVIWGVWHFLVTYWASGDATGVLQMSLLLPPLVFYAVVLPPFRVFMVWVYDRTESLLLAILMHASLTASTLFILIPQETALIPYYLIFATVLWIAVAAWAARSHKNQA